MILVHVHRMLNNTVFQFCVARTNGINLNCATRNVSAAFPPSAPVAFLSKPSSHSSTQPVIDSNFWFIQISPPYPLLEKTKWKENKTGKICSSPGSFAFVWVSSYRLVPFHVFRDPGFLNARAGQRLPEHQGRNHGQLLRSFLCAPRWLHVPRFTFATYLTMNALLERTFQNKCSALTLNHLEPQNVNKIIFSLILL